MNRQPPTPRDRSDDAASSARSHAHADAANPNDNLDAAEQALRDGPAPLGEDGGDPAHTRSNER